MELCATLRPSLVGMKVGVVPSSSCCRWNVHTPAAARISVRSSVVPPRPSASTGCVEAENVKASALAAVLLPVAAACTVLTAWPISAEAGILSGSTGLQSFEIPSLPETGIIKQIQEANKKKYEELDAKFKASPYLQSLLKKSKENAEMHKKEIEDKYCERGAEWGVGDCSLVGLPQADKDAFMEALRRGKK